MFFEARFDPRSWVWFKKIDRETTKLIVAQVANCHGKSRYRQTLRSSGYM